MNPEADRSLGTEPCHCGSGLVHFADAHRRIDASCRVSAYALPAHERTERRRRNRAARTARRAHRKGR